MDFSLLPVWFPLCYLIVAAINALQLRVTCVTLNIISRNWQRSADHITLPDITRVLPRWFLNITLPNVTSILPGLFIHLNFLETFLWFLIKSCLSSKGVDLIRLFFLFLIESCLSTQIVDLIRLWALLLHFFFHHELFHRRLIFDRLYDLRICLKLIFNQNKVFIIHYIPPLRYLINLFRRFLRILIPLLLLVLLLRVTFRRFFIFNPSLFRCSLRSCLLSLSGPLPRFFYKLMSILQLQRFHKLILLLNQILKSLIVVQIAVGVPEYLLVQNLLLFIRGLDFCMMLQTFLEVSVIHLMQRVIGESISYILEPLELYELPTFIVFHFFRLKEHEVNLRDWLKNKNVKDLDAIKNNHSVDDAAEDPTDQVSSIRA